MRNRYADSGSATLFFVAVMLPITIFLFSLSVDLSSYYHEVRRHQEAADNAALFAGGYLPFRQDTERAVQFAPSLREVASAAVSHEMTAGSVQVSLSATFRPVFARYFNADISIPIRVAATAGIARSDSLIVVDVSAGAAPSPTGESGWGTAAEFPVADFSRVNPTRLNGRILDARVMTQQCFNPVLTSLKQAGIDLYSYLSSDTHRSRVGVAIIPGGGDWLQLLRGVVSQSHGLAEATVPLYQSLTSSDTYCAALAEQELNHDEYKAPRMITGIPLWQKAGGPSRSVDPVTRTYDPSFAPFHSLRKALWDLSVRSERVHRFDHVLRSAVSLVQATGHADVEKQLFFVAAGFPVTGEEFPAPATVAKLRETVHEIGAETGLRPLQLTYVIVGQKAQNLEAIAALESVLQSSSAVKGRVVPVLSADRDSLRAVLETFKKGGVVLK